MKYNSELYKKGHLWFEQKKGLTHNDLVPGQLFLFSILWDIMPLPAVYLGHNGDKFYYRYQNDGGIRSVSSCDSESYFGHHHLDGLWTQVFI